MILFLIWYILVCILTGALLSYASVGTCNKKHFMTVSILTFFASIIITPILAVLIDSNIVLRKMLENNK